MTTQYRFQQTTGIEQTEQWWILKQWNIYQNPMNLKWYCIERHEKNKSIHLTIIFV